MLPSLSVSFFQPVSYTHLQEGTTFSGETLTALAPFEGITVKLDLPDQYFIYPKSADYSLPLTLLGGLITLFSIFCLMRWGRDEALIVPVEFTAPEGISSTEVGMILNGSVPVSYTHLARLKPSDAQLDQLQQPAFISFTE